jgi:hypothetical protein
MQHFGHGHWCCSYLESKDLASGRPKDQIIWRTLVTSLLTMMALRVVCLMVIDPTGRDRFSNGGMALLFIAALWASQLTEYRV